MPDETSEAPAPPPTSPGESGKPPTGEPGPATENWEVRYKYLLADFDNFRRRVDRDRESISRQARAGLVRELLPIIEAFGVARAAFAKLPATDATRKGLDLLDHEWTKFLKHEGVEPVASVGGAFHPEEAEAVGEVPADDQHPAGAVAEVVQQGYRFYGGLLRPAKVIVARSVPPTPGEPAAETESASQE